MSIQKVRAAPASDTEKRPIGKTDHVKTSRQRQVKAFLFASLILLVPNCHVRAAQDVDLILAEGNVYTVNEKQPHAEAIAVKGDRITFVGSNEDAEKLKGDKTRVIDLHGHTVIPGLTDSHCHIFGIGEREMNLNLEGTNIRQGFLAKVKARVAQTPPGKWITVRGWIETFWKPGSFPPARMSMPSHWVRSEEDYN